MKSNFQKWAETNDPEPPEDRGCFIVLLILFLVILALAARATYYAVFP